MRRRSTLRLAGAVVDVDRYGMSIFDHHQALLRASAISVTVARCRGYVSVDTLVRLDHAEFRPSQRRVPGLLIPLYGVAGELVGHQYRPDNPRTRDGRDIKYETPAGMRMTLDVHPSMTGQLGNPTVPLIVTEGVRKGDSAVTAFGVPVVSLLGVWNWRGTNSDGGKVALAQWESIALQDREVILAFDSDAMINRSVHSALDRLGAFLASKGAKVSYAYLPDGVADKTGLDDWIANQNARTLDDLRALCEPGLRPLPGPDADGRLRLTDTGNAERLVAAHGDDIRWVEAWQKWVVWNGQRWARDDTGEVERRAKTVARAIWGEAAEANDLEQRKALAAHAKKSESRSLIRAMIELARSEPGVAVRPDDFDTDPLQLNMPNGTLDLTTLVLHPHDRADYCMKMTGAAWPTQDGHLAPVLEAFLQRCFNASAALIGFLRRAAGYSLSGLSNAHVLLLNHGTGANGKSTFFGALREALGDYAQVAPPDLLVGQRNSGGPTPEIARLRGARMVIVSETADGAKLNETLVKSLTGGEVITGRHLHSAFEEIPPTWTPWLATNYLPDISGTDHAIWRRIRAIPWTVTIPEDERDANLPDRLRQELPQLLCWAAQGCVEYLTGGLQAPPEVMAATAAYKADQDVIGQWLDDECVTTPAAQCTEAAAWTSFEKWREATGERQMTRRKFASALVERGITGEKTGKDHKKVLFGLALRNPVGSYGMSFRP